MVQVGQEQVDHPVLLVLLVLQAPQVVQVHLALQELKGILLFGNIVLTQQ
jgi:hypothetical protein